MKKEIRTIVYDDALRLEAYRLQGIVRPFPNHFHAYYVVGLVESGARFLTCKNQSYDLKQGDIVLFNPGDNHACAHRGDEPLDYRCFNIARETMLELAEELTGVRELPGFSQTVLRDDEIACYLHELHGQLMCGGPAFGKEENLLLLLSRLLSLCGKPFQACVPECRGTTFISTKVLLTDFQPVEILFFRFFIGLTALLLVYPHRLKCTTRKQEGLFLAAGLCGVCLYYLLEYIALTHTMATILTTRRVFFYGIVCMIPALFGFGFKLNLSRFSEPVNLFNIAFLGLGASALCFVTWNFSVKVLGAVKTCIYIYIVPVVTMVTSVLVLHETITPLAGIGTALTLAGLFLSERKSLRTGPKKSSVPQDSKFV